jgi:NADH-quinone oxidoreductase subunit G
VILPGAAFSEKDGTYVNTEGRVQFGERAVFAPGKPARTGRSCARWPMLWRERRLRQLRRAARRLVAEHAAFGEEGLVDYGALPAAAAKPLARSPIRSPISI